MSRILMILGLACWLWSAGPAVAQVAGQGERGDVAGADMSPEQINGLIATLEDESERQKLIEQLRLLSSARQEALPAPADRYLDTVGAQALSYLSRRSEAIGRQVAAIGAVVADLPGLAGWIGAQWSSDEARSRWRDIATNLMIVVGASLAGLWLFAVPLRRRRQALEQRRTETVAGRMLLNLAIMAMNLLPLVVFVLVANVSIAMVAPRPVTKIVVLAVVNAILIRGVIQAVVRVILSPYAGSQRIVRSRTRRQPICMYGRVAWRPSPCSDTSWPRPGCFWE